MEMYDVLSKLKAIENPNEDQVRAIENAEKMNNPTNPSATNALMPETNTISATGQEVYQPVAEESPTEYAKLAGIQTLNVQTDAPATTNESVVTEGNDYFVKARELFAYETVVNADSEEEAEEKAVEQIEADREEYSLGSDGVQVEYTDVMESAKPDFLDLDKDGDKEESMKKAAKDKEEMKEEDTTPEQYEKNERVSEEVVAEEDKGPVKVVSWIDTNGGQTEAILLRKGDEYALATDLANMDPEAWWEAGPDAHWEEFTDTAKRLPGHGVYHWKSKDEFDQWAKDNTSTYAKNIKFGVNFREPMEEIELDEAYDPIHVADIVKKHEKEGNKVQMDRPEDDAQGFTVTFKDGKKRHYKYHKGGVKVQSMEPEDPMVDPDAPKRGKGRPKKESEELNLDSMMEEFEKKYAEQLNEGLQVTQSIDDEGKENININANNAHADMVKELLKLSGMRSDGYKEYQGQEEPVEEERDPEYTNSPREKTTTADAQLKDMSGGLNGPKDKSALKSNSNALHTESKNDIAENMMALYKDYKGN